MQVACFITMIKQESMYYPACTLQYNGRTCNKKLSDQQGDGEVWYCERCQQTSQPDWRYILSVQADDHTGHVWLTAFQVRNSHTSDLVPETEFGVRLGLSMAWRPLLCALVQMAWQALPCADSKEASFVKLFPLGGVSKQCRHRHCNPCTVPTMPRFRHTCPHLFLWVGACSLTHVCWHMVPEVNITGCRSLGWSSSGCRRRICEIWKSKTWLRLRPTCCEPCTSRFCYASRWQRKRTTMRRASKPTSCGQSSCQHGLDAPCSEPPLL